MKNNRSNKVLKLAGFEDSIISLITVTQNDADIIQKRLKSINQTLSILGINYEILIVDNNSRDETVKKIKEIPDVLKFSRILVLSKNYEKEVAITAGLDNCVGDYAIVFDFYTDPVEMIPYLLTKKLLEGNDIITGKMSKTVIKYDTLTNLFLKLTEKLSTRGFFYRQNYLMGLSRKAINSIIRTRRKSRNFGYINSLIGLTKETVEYQPLKKYLYKLKKKSLIEIILSVLDISISNSFRPIRILSVLGMLFSILYLLYVVVIIILAVFFGMKDLLPKGWITLSTVLGTMFLLLFSLLSIISEYVIRILDETRDEPFYFVSEEINKSSILPKKDTLNII